MPVRTNAASRLESLLPELITVLFGTGTLLTVAGPLRSHLPWMVYLQDDCFYYLKVADNLAAGHGSTFNGLVWTNGYHPLWLLVLVAFRIAAPHAGYFPFLVTCITASTFATYQLSRLILKRAHISQIARNALAAAVASFSLQLFFTGMEIILTIPLTLLVIWRCFTIDRERAGFKDGLALGALISAMTLSRLDAFLLVLLLAAFALLHRDLRSSLRKNFLAGIASGLAPLALYLLSNRVIFHVWMPVSGMAKQMKSGLWPSLPAWHSLLIGPGKHFVSFLPIVLAIVLFPFLYRGLSRREQVLFPALLAWPFVHVLLLSCLSDWMLWGWYFYTFRPVLCIAFLLLCRSTRMALFFRRTPAAVALACVAIFKSFTLHWLPGDMPSMVEVAERIHDFSRSHPGIYAMGDRSGVVGYLLDQPLVQTEGLMMDAGFLAAIRGRGDLRTELAQYGTRYYIATQYPPYAEPFVAHEPGQAGPSSPQLTSVFQETPVYVFSQEKIKTSIFDLTETSGR